ncbi:lipoprotein-anchoring transpeptidase ErfK/SrfK [Rhizobium sp. BK529]|uniref:L,D-transpeptidase n=1 Tax=unclassified Rhizobium TaxID=2613769 RepID=UPI00104A1DA9|nr:MULTISPECIES: L,D-transpeptidase [unclassified Rhizobium]MBB3592138.1 lipoprotein-anchoring transpeptidase ErfK/SrfK [Rhizobium sp. BK529]TCS06560.1 lipoprotein-anchoring transpeptidase ErfK/SrfK [Rhizobium sp. BK418]
MNFLRQALPFAGLAAAAMTLSGCNILVPDVAADSPARFVQEISPVFYEPPGVDPRRVKPIPDQPVPQTRELYKTQFHQTYGLPVSNPLHLDMDRYGQVRDGDFTLPAIPTSRIQPEYLRQEVDYQTNERPGTIVVDTKDRFLYFVEGNGKAMRYGVGLGREGYSWKGRGVIQWKQKWPRWTPPVEMVSRQPEVRPFSAANGGMNPGLANPLGARALYIFKNGQDTLYRIHGTPDWQSVGKAVSSGCVRMLNQDVVDLYDRVPAKSEIVVM